MRTNDELLNLLNASDKSPTACHTLLELEYTTMRLAQHRSSCTK